MEPGLKQLEELEQLWTTGNAFHTIMKIHFSQHEEKKFYLSMVSRIQKILEQTPEIDHARISLLCEKIYYADMAMEALARLSRANEKGYYSLVPRGKILKRCTEDESSQSHLSLFILEKLFLDRCRKHNSTVMIPVYTEEGYYSFVWKELCTISEYLHRVIKKEENPRIWSLFISYGKKTVEYLKSHHDAEFPEFIKDRHLFAFRNGVYHIRHEEKGLWSDRFYTYPVVSTFPEHLAACKSFQQCLDYESIKTPSMDQFFEQQGYHEQEMFWVYVFLGRLLYHVGDKDNWNLVPLWTGKQSDVFHRLCTMFYDSTELGSFTKQMSAYFNEYNHRFLILGTEITHPFIDTYMLREMLAGNTISIPGRQRCNEQQIRWKIPMALFGIHSFLTSTVVFPFEKETDLPSLEQEFPCILVKAVRSYIQAVKKFGRDHIPIPTRFSGAQDKTCHPKTGVVYRIVNKVDDKVYVGSTARSLPQRLYEHKEQCRKGSGDLLHQHMRDIGIRNFSIEEIEQVSFVDRKEVLDRERYHIQREGTLNMKR